MLKEEGGYSLMGARRSLRALVQRLYPEYPWVAEKFVDKERVSAGYWLDKSNLMKEIEGAERSLGIKHVRLISFANFFLIVIFSLRIGTRSP